MFSEPVRAIDLKIVTFQDGFESLLNKKVNDWLKNQTQDIVILDVMLGHAMVVENERTDLSFTLTIAYKSQHIVGQT